MPYLEKAHRAQPQDTVTLLALARAEVASGDLSQARQFYDEASLRAPQNAAAFYGLGIVDRVLAEQQLKQAKHSEQTAGGSEAFRKSQALLNSSKQAMSNAMQLDPGSVRAHMILGESFPHSGALRFSDSRVQSCFGAGPGLGSGMGRFGSHL